MNEYLQILSGLVVFMAIGCYFGYRKIARMERRLLQIEVTGAVQKSVKVNSSTEIKSNKRLNELNDLTTLKEYISAMKVDRTFIERCLEKIESEIGVQEYIYFRELGEDIHKNSK